MFRHIHGTVARIQIHASMVPVQVRNYPEAVTVLPIPVKNQAVTEKFRVLMTDALHISHSIMQAWESQLPHIRLQPVIITAVQVQEHQEALTVASIPAQKVPAQIRY